MKKIRINIPEKEYNVYLGKDIFSKLSRLMINESITGNIFLVIDSNVKKYYSKIIEDAFHKSNSRVRSLTINASEKHKSYETLQKIHAALIKNNFGRDTVIIAIGGGIIGDISGFAASTYMRGVKYVQVPTTLLASVDSSVGGKTGINFNKTKNIIGSFYQPELVLIDTNFFDTLPPEEMLCGLGETIKYCFLTNDKFFNLVKTNVDNILSNEPKIIRKVITESINFKGGIVEADEKESGIRKVLNLGHTFAHAFEVEQKHSLKHGQAVIVGITCALYLSKMLEFVDDKNFNKYQDLLLIFGSMIKLKPVNKAMLFKVMQLDKKNRGNEIKFVLLKNIGEIITDISVPRDLVYKAITKTISHF